MQTLFPSENSQTDNSQINPGAMNPLTQDVANPWVNVKEKLRQLIDPESFEKWIEPLNARAMSDSEFVIFLPDMMHYQEILNNFIDKFDDCKAALGLNAFFRFEIQQDKGINPPTTQNEKPAVEEKNAAPEPEMKPPQYETPGGGFSRALTSHTHLNKEYGFDSFVNGPSNQFAHASCLAVADNPGQTYNPLFLYGSTGLGKTHLLHAVGNKILATRGDSVITYISSERFMNEMIYCLRFNKMWDFRKKYRNSDVLLVDDIQFISGKERTQEEFFHTFNALYEAKKQIIVTSDIFPQDIPDIEDRLRNRFQWGLIADIQPPDIEHRVAILMNKAEKQKVHLSQDVAQFIASHAKGNIRVLEGALRRVIAFASLHGRPLDTRLAAEILQDVLGEPEKTLTIEIIQKTVADHFKVRISDLKSKKRQRAISLPRQIAMYLSRTRTQSSFPEIGSMFGGKDHTTVIHAVKKISVDKRNDIEIRSEIEAVERKLDQQY